MAELIAQPRVILAVPDKQLSVLAIKPRSSGRGYKAPSPVKDV